MKLAVLALALCACTPAQRTGALAVASTAGLMVDWSQTLKITSTCRERNPFIGECGEKMSPDLYFTAAISAHLITGYVLGKTWREIWFASIAGVSWNTAYNNQQRMKPGAY